jgi:uncharacterized protein (TIGR03067 family)
MFLAACVFILASVQSSSQTKDATDELKKLQGTWRLVGGEEVGRKMTAEEAENEKELWTFTDELMVATRDGKIAGKATVRIMLGKDFGEIDFNHKGGQYDGKTCHAIYLLDGNDLKICTASKLRSDEPEDRPTVFSTGKSDKEGEKPGKLLLLLKREKK